MNFIDGGNGSISAGEAFGIIVALLFAIALLFSLLYLIYRKKPRMLPKPLHDIIQKCENCVSRSSHHEQLDGNGHSANS